MTGPATIQERRVLNQEIESTFIAAAQAAANLEMKIALSKGKLGGDFQDFYSCFSYLVRLTMRLKDMQEKAKIDEGSPSLKIQIKVWLGTDIQRMGETNEVAYYKRGLDLFDAYYEKLTYAGIISLPTKKG